MTFERLDVLIYGHDGRGLGHASRSVAIGMALRRLYPELKVLFVSGCSFTQEMIGEAPLDWIKLPSYRTQVVDGKSRGADGFTLYSDKELGGLRRRALADIVGLYRPRVVLVDHTPQGKHRELLDALELSHEVNSEKTRWILGVRGVVGDVAQAKSEQAIELFKKYFAGLLWYGDKNILGEKDLNLLKRQYGIQPYQCGYVPRLAEYIEVNNVTTSGIKYAGTIAVPWYGEHTEHFLSCLAKVLPNLDKKLGEWCIFLPFGTGDKAIEEVYKRFQKIPNCTVQPPSKNYVSTLQQSKIAVIYGGYNSLMDVLWLEKPSIIILREMADAEQQIHLQSLQSALSNMFSVVSEGSVSSDALKEILLAKLNQKEISIRDTVNLRGATQAAEFLFNNVGE